MKDDDPTYVPGICSRKGQPKTQDAPDLECATPELSQGYRILQALVGISRYFLELPDHTQKGMLDYYDVVSKPVCFREIQRKFADGEYSKISEFVMDVRCLLLNCYTYFGPSDIHTQKALKVEQVLKEKLALLPEDLRTLCSLEAENAQTVTSAEGVQSQLLQSVIGEKSRREHERKQRLSEERRKEEEGEGRDLVLWEQERLFTGTAREKMESMWELAVIGHFAVLSLEQLNISSISMFEVERMVFMPQASKSLSVLMTALLSTPLCRLKLHMKPPMPYRTWTKKLELKVSYWYKMYIKSDKNANFMFEKFGIEHQFWKILGTWNPLEEYEFHELSVYQRVILIKAICDYILQNHKILKDTIAEKRDEFGKCLGHDRSGAKFFYFPQLLDQCIRIYRQTSEPKSWMDRDLEYTKLLAEKCNGSTTIKRRGRKAKNRGKIAKEKNHSDIAITRKSLRNTPKPMEISVSVLASASHQANESSNCGTAGYEGEASSNESGLKVLGNKHSSRRTGRSPSSINKNLFEEIRHEPSISTSCGIDTHLENEPNSSQTSVSEDVYTSYNESHHNKCSSECSDSVSSCNLETKQACDVQCNNKVLPIMVENKNDFTVDQSECVSVQNMPSYQTQNIHEDSNAVIKVSKTRRPLYIPHWLEPNPDDFRLVVDTVEGVRQLLTKYRDDDSVVMSRQLNNKSGKGCRPLCEVKLFRQLSSLLSDLDCVEIKILTNTRSAREKLYKEWVEFSNRPTDYIDPDEAFWNNEKEPAETSECQTPETHLSQTSDVLEDTELPQTPQVTDPDDTAEDTLKKCASGMKLRRRTVTKEKFDGLDVSDVSTDVHSDDSDNWEVSKSRKNRSKKRKRIISPALLNSSKKKRAAEECPQKPPLNKEEASSKMVQDSMSTIEIQNAVEKSAAKKRRVRKNLFPCTEASSCEPCHQLQQEEICERLVNSSNDKSDDIAVPDASRTTISVRQAGRITAVQAETDIICISDDSDDEIEWLCSKYNPKLDYKLHRNKQGVKKDEQSAVKTEGNLTPKQTHISPKSDPCVQRSIPTCGIGAASSTGSSVNTLPNQVQTLITNPNNNTAYLTRNSTILHVKVEEEFPVMHNHVETHTVAENQDSVSEAALTVQPSGSSYSVSGNSVLQTESVEHVQSHIPGVSTAKTVLSSIPSYSTQKNRNVPVRTQDTLTAKQTHYAPKSNPCVQRMVPTSEMEAASSNDSSVSTLSNQVQTLDTNPNNNTTYLTRNSTILHDKVEEEFPVKHNHVGTHTVAENQDSVSEAVLTVQPSGSSYSVSGNSVLRTESIEHVQSHITGLGTAKTVLSPIPSYSTQNNRNVPLRTQDTLTPKQTHNAPKSNPCVKRVVSTYEMEAAASTGCSVSTLQQYFQTPVTNPDNNATYLTHNSIHDNIEEVFPVDRRSVGIHTVTENQDNMSEAVLTVQPSGSSYSVSGNSVLQTESVEHVQRHIPGLSTANTILSPLPLSSPQNNPNTPVHHSLAAGETITSVQHSSSTSNGPVHKLQINVGSQIVPSHVPASQGSNIHPYIFILGSSPGTSVIQVTTDTTNRPPHARTQDISSDAQLVRTDSPGFNSSTSSRIPYPQLTQTRIPNPQLVDPLVDRARNCHLPVYQTNDNLPVAVRSFHLPSVQTRNPGFSSTPTERSHTHTQHPHSHLANTRVPGIHLPSHTPEGLTRIPGTPLTKTRNSVTTAVQTRSPSTPVAHTSSAGTVLGKMSPGTPVAYTSCAGTVIGKTRSPGTPVAHASSSGTVLGKTRSPGTPLAHTSSSGTMLGKTRSPGTPVAHTHNPSTVLGKTRSPGKICFSQASSSGVSVVQARNSGSSLFRAQTPVAHVNPGARLPHGRGHPSSRPERDWTDVVQQRDQTARLVVIPGDDNVSRYGLVFPSGAKVILTPEQVAEIRAANGGLLTSNFGM